MGKVVYQNVSADRHAFVIPGVIDPDVVKAQAAKRLSEKGESTYIHYHAKHLLGDNGEEIPTLVQCTSSNHQAVGVVSTVV